MIVIFLGAPGSGKGTQASMLESAFNTYKVSTGDLVRSEIKSGSERGLRIKSLVDSGSFIPDDDMYSLIEGVFNIKSDILLFDGFPRTLNQARKLDSILESKAIKNIKVIYFQIEDKVVIKRVASRVVCQSCGSVFGDWVSVDSNCEKCTAIGSLYRRADDDFEALKKRLEVYHSETLPLVDYYNEKGIVGVINADDYAENIFEKIKLFLFGEKD
jgi:adenylate kinase